LCACLRHGDIILSNGMLNGAHAEVPPFWGGVPPFGGNLQARR
jgi:hypothetical protein